MKVSFPPALQNGITLVTEDKLCLLCIQFVDWDSCSLLEWQGWNGISGKNMLTTYSHRRALASDFLNPWPLESSTDVKIQVCVCVCVCVYLNTRTWAYTCIIGMVLTQAMLMHTCIHISVFWFESLWLFKFMLKFNPQCDGIKKWSLFGKWLSLQGSVSLSGIGALIKSWREPGPRGSRL
jgi:hypothetical protein